MKAILIKEYQDYYLISDKEIESGDEYVKLDNRPRTVLLGTTAPSTKVPKLSKQNCDEIFGGFDVEKLAEECSIDWEGEVMEHIVSIYKEGFNKAMELNKDKVFTEEDVLKVANIFYQVGMTKSTYTKEDVLESLQQPTEIEVEVEMKPYTEVSEGWILDKKEEPKLDENGCLILTKKI